MAVVLSGNEAVARGAYEAGISVATAYPGTPSTEIIENLVKYEVIYGEWSPNEKVALEVGFGASLGGARTLVAMKHVGLNVAADPLMTLSYTGVNGGLVIITADDPGMHSSQNEQDNRFYARFAKIPLIEPSDSQEAKDFLKEAFIISEKFDTPVLYRLTTRVAHSRSLVELGEREEKPVKTYQKQIEKKVMLPVYARKRHLDIENRRRQLETFNNDLNLNQIFWGKKDLGIISSGICYQYAREVFADQASYLKLGMTYPLPWGLIENFVRQVEKVVVVEELEPFIEDQLKTRGIKVIGKDLFPRTGELNPEIVAEGLDEKSRFQVSFPVQESLPVRPPMMCPGCPHRGVFYTLKKLKVIVTGDIGCYTLGALPPFEAMDSCLCMGASIGASLGLEKAQGKSFARKTVAVIGDSTFIHSGITGLLDLVYNKGTNTVIILDNRTTAMTGHQDHPGTGYTLKKEETAKIDFSALVRALGIKRVRKVDPYALDKLEEALAEELAAEEVSVVITERPCALMIKKVGKIIVLPDQCKECKKCLQLGCPAIVLTDDGISLDQELCNGCGLCAQVCPHGALQVKEGKDND